MGTVIYHYDIAESTRKERNPWVRISTIDINRFSLGVEDERADEGRDGTSESSLISRYSIKFSGGKAAGKIRLWFHFSFSIFFLFLLRPFLATMFFAGYFLVRSLLSVFPAFFL